MTKAVGEEPRLTEPRVIHRLQLPLTDRHVVSFPQCSQIVKLAPGRDGECIDLWYERNAESCESVITVAFWIYGTGHRILQGEYVDTVVMPNDFVWHVYLEVLS